MLETPLFHHKNNGKTMSSEAHHPIFDPIWSSKMANWKILRFSLIDFTMYIRAYKYMYICIYIYMYVHKLCIHIYIYREREREKERCLFSLGISQLAMFDDCCGMLWVLCVEFKPKKHQIPPVEKGETPSLVSPIRAIFRQCSRAETLQKRSLIIPRKRDLFIILLPSGYST